MRTKSFLPLFLSLLLLATACAKPPEVCDPGANLDPELFDAEFLKIKRGRPLTDQEKAALASKTDISFHLNVEETEEVQLFLQYYAVDKRRNMELWLDQARPYLPYVRAALASQKLPPDLIVLPFIESGYKNNAISCAGAVGMWQFMPATGKRFDLNVDYWIDDRRNPYLATVAASRYLGELYGMFGDWQLALAAYNAGEGKVGRSLNSTGTTNFKDLAQTSALKDETRHYVPRFLAVLKIFRNLDKLGFKPVNWGAGETMAELKAPGGTDLAAMAEACQMSWDDFSRANPAFRRQVSPPDRTCPVYVPQAKKELAQNYLNNPTRFAKRGMTTMTASAGDTWMSLSRRSGVPVVNLRQMNPDLAEQIVAGASVNYPAAASLAENSLDPDPSTAIRTAATPQAGAPSAVSMASRSHTFARGETLMGVSHKYGVPVAAILAANNLKAGSGIKAGKVLVIPAKADAGRANAPTAVSAAQPVQLASAGGKAGVAVPAQAASKQPATQSGAACTIAQGDTAYGLARRFGVSVDALLAANNLKSPNELRVGKIICIPAGGNAQAVAQTPAPAQPSQASQASKAADALASKTVAQASAQAQPVQAAKAAKAEDKAQPRQADKAADRKGEAKADEKAVAEVKPNAASQQPQLRGVSQKSVKATHQVAGGETLYSIARKHKVDPKELAVWNNLSPSSTLRPGDKLKLY